METLRIDGHLFTTWSSLSEKCKDSARRLFSMKAPHLPLSAYFYRVHPDGTVDCEGGRWIPPGMEDVLRDERTIRQIQES